MHHFGRFVKRSRPDLSAITCAGLRDQVQRAGAALLDMPYELALPLVGRLLPLVDEALDRAQHGYLVCGSLIARPNGECRAEGGHR